MVNTIDKNKRLLGESPIWDERLQALYFVDILEKKLFCYFDSEGRIEQHDFSEYLSSIALQQDAGRILLALESGIYDYHLADRKMTFFTQPESKENYRFNDGKVDAEGNWLLGSMNNINNGPQATHLPDASLYIIKGKQVRVLIDGVTISNGIAFHGEHLYYIDSKLQNLRRFRYQNRTLSEEEVVYQFHGQDMPDGMTLSKSGKLYIAIWGGKRIDVWDIHRQALERSIDLPCLNPTSCTFGGKDLNELFITCSSLGDENPELSGLYSIRLQDEGLPENKIC